MIQSFRSEVDITGRLSHPNIVKLLGFVEDAEAGIAWMVFNWEENGNIRDFLRNGQWDLPERVFLVSKKSTIGDSLLSYHPELLQFQIQDVAAGLEYLHNQEPPICHGDLKTLNILVTSSCRAVIADFGSARAKMRVDGQDPKSTEPPAAIANLPEGQLIVVDHFDGHLILTGPKWTLNWAAPELLDGKEPDLSSDVWSLGWICWEPSPGSVDESKVRSAELLWQLGRLSFFQAQQEDAICRLEESLSVARRTEDLPLVAGVLIHRGDASRHASRYEEAESFYNEALVIYSNTSSAVGMAYGNLALGDLRRLQGRFDEAEKHLNAALEGGCRCSIPSLQADALFGLAATYRLRDLPPYTRAQEHFELALHKYTELRDERGRAISVDGLGLIFGAQGKVSKAMAAFKEELKISKRLGCKLSRAHALLGLGLVHANHGRYARARERFEEAVELYRMLGQEESEKRALACRDAAVRDERQRTRGLCS
ncbi:hypothetical protein FRC04_009508 [Tulasnella sp. 424]|nr:hypothetical protein FRC04_009508 [Tulasnella sp. 424]KAG8971226.1 hypothetical protein FRC05_011421 [Tulasnella sp. 425]